MAELLIIGGIVAAAGALQQGAAAESEAISAQNVANFNAAVQRQEAKAIEQKGAFVQRRQAEEGVRVLSTQKVKIAKAGGILSPVREDLEAEQLAELELENLLIGFETQTQKGRALTQAELDVAQGKLVRQKGKNLRTASKFKAGASLLQGFGFAGAL